MKKNYATLRFIVTFIVVCSLMATKGFAQIGTEFFIQGPANWQTDVFSELNYTGSPANSSNTIATTFGGLTNPGGANPNDFTGLKLTFSAYVSSSGISNTVVLGSDAVWGGEGIVIEINKFQIRAIRNFQYSDAFNPVVSFTATDNAGYQASILPDQHNKFIIEVSATGSITINVNGIAYPTAYDADLTILQATGAARYALFSSGFTDFKMKDLIAEKGGVTKTYFKSDFKTRYAATPNDWTLNATSELSFNGNVPFNTPAIVETTFGGLTAPTATTNDFTGLKLTFDAFVSANPGENINVLLSWNGIWGSPTGRGIIFTINKDDLLRSISFAAATSLNSSTAAYQAAITPGAYNHFVIDVAANSAVTITVNSSYTCPIAFTATTLTAALPNPRYAVFGTDFSGFKLKNLSAEKGGITKNYFGATLPVTLVKYQATKKPNGSLLNWETAAETNNSHYLIYRSTDGNDFKQLTRIPAKNEAARYQYLDAAPIAGNNYYKLVQVDLDGTATDLGVEVVKFDLKVDNTVLMYPKPADQRVNLSFNRTFQNPLTVKLFDLSGRELQTVVIPVQKELINYALDLDKRITSGLYVISVSSTDYKHSEKLIVK